METGTQFLARLARLRTPLVREVRGRGLMIGLDLRVKPQPALTRLLDAGYLALPAGTTVLRMLPPLAIDPAVLDAAAEALDEILCDPALAPSAEVGA
jgi:acetylornithine/LysW-gamma-L-lysine aminotransferase